MDHPKDHSLFGLGLPGFLNAENTNSDKQTNKKNQNNMPQIHQIQFIKCLG